jgi:hypothetical protein
MFEYGHRTDVGALRGREPYCIYPNGGHVSGPTPCRICLVNTLTGSRALLRRPGEGVGRDLGPAVGGDFPPSTS